MHHGIFMRVIGLRAQTAQLEVWNRQQRAQQDVLTKLFHLFFFHKLIN